MEMDGDDATQCEKVKKKAQVEKDEGPEAKTLSRLLIVAEGPN